MKRRLLISVLLMVLLALGCFTVTANGATTSSLSAPDVNISNVASSGKIKLTWDKVDNAVEYKVYRATSKSGTYSVLGTTTGTSFTNNSAVAGKTYYYYVVAVNKAGKTSFKSDIVLRKCDLPRPVITLSSVADSGRIRVTWEAIDGAKEYKVYRATGKSGNYYEVYTTTGTSFTNKSVTAGKTYYYKVKAIAPSSSANSAFSSAKYRTCDCARPVITLSSVADSGRIKVTWEEIDGAKAYDVYRATSKTGTYSKIYTTTGTSFTNKSVTAGKTYYYKVKAIGSSSSADSAFSSVKYRVCDLPRPVITVALNDSGKPMISWEPIPGAQEYEVYRATTENGTYSLLGTTIGTSYNNPGAGNGVTYYYKVKAKASKTSADSAYSKIATFTTEPVGETFETSYVYQPSLTIYTVPSSSEEGIKLPYMTEVKKGSFIYDDATQGWCRLYYNDNLYYTYIQNDALTSEKSTYEYEGATEDQQKVIDIAMNIHDNWDTYYAHKDSDGVADEDGRYGFDCSGFASYVLDESMASKVPVYDVSADIIKLYNTDLIYNEGLSGEYRVKTISLEDIQPGDVIFFNLDEETGVDHCGIYMGNDEFIHSTEIWDGVCIAPLRGMYKEGMMEIKRFLPKEVTFANEEKRMNVTWSGLCEEANEDVVVTTPLGLGDLVTVQFVSSNGVWSYVVTDDGQKGYVLSQYLTDADEMKPLNQTKTINVGYTGLRTEANSDLPITTELAQGESVTLLYISSTGSWGYVKTSDGEKGYVLMKYMD